MKFLLHLLLLVVLLFACNKKEELAPVDNSKLIGRWRWNSTTYYTVAANSLIRNSVLYGDSTSFIQFGANSLLILHFLGAPEQGEYTYAPANTILQKYLAGNRKEIDTVKTLTSTSLILHVKVVDTPLYNPIVIRTLLRIDSLSK